MSFNTSAQLAVLKKHCIDNVCNIFLYYCIKLENKLHISLNKQSWSTWTWN